MRLQNVAKEALEQARSAYQQICVVFNRYREDLINLGYMKVAYKNI